MMGSGKNGELTFLDLITIISFVIGLQNLEINITQDDLQNVAARSDKRQTEGIEDIHNHLAVQDAKLNTILDMLEVISNDRRGDI
jgi:hypothetical protein